MQLRVELATLLGLNAHPGELAGWSPVGAARAASLAAEYAAGHWQWTVTDTEGYLLRAGSTRQRPHGYPARTGHCQAVTELLVPHALLHRLLERDGGGLAVEADQLRRWRPVLADIAARLATEPPPEHHPTRRLPGAQLRRAVQQAIPSCVGPYCTTPSRRSEIDHLHEHARGGTTLFPNLAPLCKPTHRLKTIGAVRIERTGPWNFTTITRLGNTFTVTSRPLIEALPDPRPATEQYPEREPADDDWRTDEPWDTRIPKPRPSRDWVATKAAALRAKRQPRRRPPPPRASAAPPSVPDDDPPPF